MKLLDCTGGTVVKNPPANARDTDSIPGSGRLLRVGSGNLFQYSCLENSMDRGAQWDHWAMEPSGIIGLQSMGSKRFRNYWAHTHSSSIFSFSEEPQYCFPLWLDQFIFPVIEHEGYLFFTFLPILVTCISNNIHSDRCEMISYYGFDFCFTDDWWCWASFNVHTAHLYFFLRKCLFWSSAHFLIELFVFLMLSYMSLLYILDINPLLDISFANIFSHSITGLFISLIGPLLCKSF